MSLKGKTDALFWAAGSHETTPEDMRSIIAGLKYDPEFAGGAFLTALQGALHIALMPDNEAESERRLGVIKVIADAVAVNMDFGREYVREVVEKSAAARRNPESIIGKFLG